MLVGVELPITFGLYIVQLDFHLRRWASVALVLGLELGEVPLILRHELLLLLLNVNVNVTFDLLVIAILCLVLNLFDPLLLFGGLLLLLLGSLAWRLLLGRLDLFLDV